MGTILLVLLFSINILVSCCLFIKGFKLLRFFCALLCILLIRVFYFYLALA